MLWGTIQISELWSGGWETALITNAPQVLLGARPACNNCFQLAWGVGLPTSEPDHLRTHIHGFHLQWRVLIICHISKASPGETDVLDVIRPLPQRPCTWFKPQLPSFTLSPRLNPMSSKCVPIRQHPHKGRVWSYLVSKWRHIVDFSEHSQIFQGYPEHCWTDREALSQATFFFSNFPLIRGYCEPSILVFCKEIIQFQGIRLFQRSQENKHTFSVLKPLPPLNLSFLEYLHW